MKTRLWIIELLKGLEVAIPPAPTCHHAITFAQYGSDEVGWDDRLALQVGVGGEFHCLFLDDSDMEKPAGQLICEVVAALAVPMDGEQISATPTSYNPSEPAARHMAGFKGK